jgi:hypothetical protein
MSAGYMATANWMNGSVEASNSAGDLSSHGKPGRGVAELGVGIKPIHADLLELGLERSIALGCIDLAIFAQGLIQDRAIDGRREAPLDRGQALLGRQPITILVAALAQGIGLGALLGPAIGGARRRQQLRATDRAEPHIVERGLIGLGHEGVEPRRIMVARALGIRCDPGAILRFGRLLARGKAEPIGSRHLAQILLFVIVSTLHDRRIFDRRVSIAGRLLLDQVRIVLQQLLLDRQHGVEIELSPRPR